MSTKIDLEAKDKDYYHQTDPQYKLRWPESLRQKVAESAKEHNRSMNADIVARLERSFELGFHKKFIDDIPTEVLMMELSNRFKGFSIVMMENKDIKKAP